MEDYELQELFIFDELEKFIFFDLKDKGILVRVEGDYKPIYNENCLLISQNDDLDSIIMAQTRNESLKILGKEYENVYISYVPAKELSYLELNKTINSQIKENELLFIYKIPSKKIFSIIEKPLLKISKENDNFLKSNELNKEENNLFYCVLSGKRSSIIFSDNKFAIRLKGSGNNFNGFQLGEVLNIAKNHFEIFGCQFKNTCLREQFVCNKINDKLKDYKFFCGNLPIGYWKYEKSFLDKLKNETKLNLNIISKHYFSKLF